ncbi:MAG: type II secretion system protein M, partial [Burkholderiaceae bacterium]
KVTSDQASVTLPVTPAATLGNWLADVRSNARLSPVNARLTQTAPPPAAAWQGSVTFALPR